MDKNVVVSLYGDIKQDMARIKDLGKGYFTNFFHDGTMVDLWDKYKLIEVHTVGETLFLFRQNEGFCHLFFCSTNFEQLEKDLEQLPEKFQRQTIVVDLVGRDEDMEHLTKPFINNGFERYSSLVRMSRQITEMEMPQPTIEYAQDKDAERIESLFNDFFDPLSEQLPLKEQIEEWIINRHLLIRRVEGQIVGFVIFDINGITSYIRYWFIHPDFREQKIGSALFRQCFAESNDTKRQIFWVIEDNENARKRQRHYGFREENMFDHILIRYS